MNSAVVRLDQVMSIFLTMNKHRLQSLLLHFVLHMPNIIYLNSNFIIIDQHKPLTIFRGVLCEIQENQSNLLTLKNQLINPRGIKHM